MTAKPIIDAPHSRAAWERLAEAAKRAGWTYVHPTWQRPATAAEIARYGRGDGLTHARTARDACVRDNIEL